MLGLIALVASIVVAIAGHRWTRRFTRRRLRYTQVAQRPGISGIVAGIAVSLLAVPVMGILPLLGTGTALLLGAGVGTGVALGAREEMVPDVR